VAVLAGASVVAGQVPGERIATQTDTADTSTFTTTETTVSTVTADLVNGRTYRVRFVGRFQSDVAGDSVNARLREDSSAGTQMQGTRVYSATATAGFGFTISFEAEYTAVATASKTFVATGERSVGSGNVMCEGSATAPRYLYVDYIRG
jgi:hypothetical protein